MASTTSRKPAAPARRKAPVKTSRTAAKPAASARLAAPAKAEAAKPSAKAAEAKTAKPAKAPKADRPKKPKLVRDSFTIPKDEYAVLEQLKQRAALAGRPAKKSELLRAGLKALAGMVDAPFLDAVSAVPSLKTGRPARA